MRCENCKASNEVHYAESDAMDWYCNAGVPDNEMYEDKNGELGCRLHWKTIQKRVEENERAWLRDKEQFVEWYLKEQENENGKK